MCKDIPCIHSMYLFCEHQGTSSCWVPNSWWQTIVFFPASMLQLQSMYSMIHCIVIQHLLAIILISQRLFLARHVPLLNIYNFIYIYIYIWLCFVGAMAVYVYEDLNKDLGFGGFLPSFSCFFCQQKWFSCWKVCLFFSYTFFVSRRQTQNQDPVKYLMKIVR